MPGGAARTARIEAVHVTERVAPVPILRQRDNLIATLQSTPNDEALLRLQHDLLEQVGRFRARGAVLDVTVVEMMDSFAVRTLRTIAESVRLRGADTVIVGIQPEVALDMVRLGLDFGDVPTALDLEEGLAYLTRLRRARVGAV
jgi:rsbT antagonist protein RsbS